MPGPADGLLMPESHRDRTNQSQPYQFAEGLRQVLQEELDRGVLAACPITAPAMSQRFYLSVSSRRKPSGAIGLVAGLIRD